MAALSVADRTRILRGLMRYWSAPDTRQSAPFSKFDLYNPVANTGAVADTDNWQDTHGGNTSADSVGFNGALAANMRTGLTLQMKGELFVAIALARTGNIELLRRVFGEVD